ncbi:MAG: competence/damage-inducible protein A [Dehalococcoidia bacterium]
MKAEIVSIGTEILLGEILDTNARYIASRLPGMGIDLYYMAQIGDNQGRLAELLRQAWGRSDLILCTGGLGPTEDDVTRDAIAAVLGEEVFVDGALEEQLRTWFTRRGATTMPERNIKQAWLTKSTRSIPNPRGTAPGWWSEKDGRIIVAMPGPPSEMARMWDEEVEPELRRRSTGVVLVSRTIKTVGIGEGQVDEMVSDLIKTSNPSTGVYARADGIHLRVTAKAASQEEGLGLIEPIEHEMLRRLGSAVWGMDDDTMEGSIIRMLAQRGLRLGTMESCTGGLLASTLTDAPGASKVFPGGIVTYMTEIKEQFGVDPQIIAQHGVVSMETAIAMAQAVRQRLQTDIGVGITGVAGPTSQDGRPVGEVHIGLHDGNAPQSMTYTFPQNREAIKRRAVTNSLLLIRRALLSADAAPRL